LQPEKHAKKVREVERRRQKLRQRIARMTPEELAKYKARSDAVKPRSATEREMRRRDREMARLLAEPRPPTPPNPELEALEAELAEVCALNRRLEAFLEGHNLTESEEVK
jgi:hypothetical protein